MLPVPDTDISGNDFAAALRRVIRCDRTGHRLMTAYYLAAAIVTIAGCVLAPPAAGIIIAAMLAGGIALLVGVTVAYQRARHPLIARWGLDAPLVHPPLRGKRGKPGRPQWHQGAGGLFYVAILLILAAVGGIITMVEDSVSAAKAVTEVSIGACNNAGHGQEELCSAQWRADGRDWRGTVSWTSDSGSVKEGLYDPKHPGVVYDASSPWFSGTVVMLGTFVLVIGPTCLVMGIQYSRRQRRPYLEAMEQKAAEAARAAPQPGP